MNTNRRTRFVNAAMAACSGAMALWAGAAFASDHAGDGWFVAVCAVVTFLSAADLWPWREP